MFHVYHVVVSVHCCLVASCWERAAFGSRLRCFIVFLSLSHVVSWVRCGTRLYQFLILATFSYFVTSYYSFGSLKPPCELNIFVLHQQQNLERTFGTSKMNLSHPPLAKAAVRSKGVVLLLMISTPIVGSCYCSMFLCVTLFTYLLHILTYLLTHLLEIDDMLKQFCF